MKKFLITLIGAVVLSQNAIQISNSRPLILTTLCVDGYKYLTTVYGYAAISTVQIFESSDNKSFPSQPATCKEK